MTFISDPDNEFEKQGVTFKIISEEMYPQVNFHHIGSDRSSRSGNLRPSVCYFSYSLMRALNLHHFCLNLYFSFPSALSQISLSALSAYSQHSFIIHGPDRRSLKYFFLLICKYIHTKLKVADFMWTHFYPHEPVSR